MSAAVDTAVIPAQRGETNPDELGSLAIVARAQAADPEAFAELYRMYHGRVFRFVLYRVGAANRQLAEDLTADAFLRALKAIHRFAPMDREYGALLMVIARNLVADHFKSSRYRVEVTTAEMLDTDQPDQGPEGQPEATTVGRTRDRLVRDAVAQLTGEQAEVIRLRFFEDMSVSETAALMGKKEGAIKALQYRATNALGRLLPELEDWR